MSIREDARNERDVKDILGYDPEEKINNLQQRLQNAYDEVSRLEKRIRSLEANLRCFNGSDK